MSLAKSNLPSTIKTALTTNPKLQRFLKPTITLSILETHLQKCHNQKQFNQILSQMIITGYVTDTYAASRLLGFSTSSSFIHSHYSRRIFDCIQNPNVFTWNSLMRMYVQRNDPAKALGLYKLMLKESDYVGPDHYTYPILFHACVSSGGSVIEGKQIHNHVLEMGFGDDVYVRNTLINMYSVCGKMEEARRVFDESPVRDSVSWNSILAGYVMLERVDEAKSVFGMMPRKNTIASNSMIALFGRTGRVDDAKELFNVMEENDMVSWSALVTCYEQNAMYGEALKMFRKMHDNGIMVDEVVTVSMLSACAHYPAVKMGKLIHGLIVKLGIECYVNLHNALIHMYSKCDEIDIAERLFNCGYSHLDQISWNSMISGYSRSGLIEKAKLLFESMPNKDLVSWSTMISGYAQHDHFMETLDLFQEMQLAGIRPDETILVSVLSACTHLAAFEQGKWVHAYIRKNGLKVNAIMGTTLINMYMKCGCVDNALDVFHGIEDRWVSTWNAAIIGLAMNGLIDKSLDMFAEMKSSDVVPNEITFMGVLGACRHMGLVDEGCSHFDLMTKEYGIRPNVKHYGCMVDLLGRAGRLKDAEELIEKMPMAPDVSTWGALLGACKKYGDVERGEGLGRKLIELKPDHDGFHVLLSNMYASKGNWDNVLEIRGMMTQHGVVKTPGCSMIEANGRVHEFLAGDDMHPQIQEIERMLDEMANKLKIEGYAPDTNEIFLEIDEEEKETSLFRHSEKLAIAFGLLNIPPPTPIRIMKNLRMCNDCHIAAKFISKAYNREIVVRDRHRFHHFKQGTCSCMDFW